MISRFKIEMDYAKAILQSSKLESLASDLEKACSDLDGSMTRLGNGWQGDEATAYRSKGGQLSEKISANARQLRETAEAVKDIAQKIRDTELENLRIAEQRKYE